MHNTHIREIDVLCVLNFFRTSEDRERFGIRDDVRHFQVDSDQMVLDLVKLSDHSVLQMLPAQQGAVVVGEEIKMPEKTSSQRQAGKAMIFVTNLRFQRGLI